MTRSPLLLAAALLALPHAAHTSAAQSAPPSRLELGGQIGAAMLYSGDADHGPRSGRALSVRAGFRLPIGARRTLLEAYGASARRSDDEYGQIPNVELAGVALRVELGRPPAERGPGAMVPFLTIGVARLRVDADEQPPCVSERGCFREGGPYFVDRTFTAPALGAGVIAPVARRAALRFDLRAHKPAGPGAGSSGDSGQLQPELAAGVTVRW